MIGYIAGSTCDIYLFDFLVLNGVVVQKGGSIEGYGRDVNVVVGKKIFSLKALGVYGIRGGNIGPVFLERFTAC